MLNVGGGILVSPLASSSGGLNCSSSLSLSMEKLLQHAATTGELILSGRNLKEFPKHCCKFQLKDTVLADLSRNKLTELPQECTDYFLLERLILYNNNIRSIPDSIVYMQSLQFLDLSRNQLSYLPPAICELPLQSLVLNNNRLVSLPEEIGKMQTLMELDASCNEIAHLPVQIGDMGSLKSLNLRRNHLQEVPVEISYLQLIFLDLSANRITSLPVELRFMTSVIEMNLGENPLSCPPANLVSRGRIHIFKYLEIQAIKEDRKRGVLTESDYRRSYRKTTQLNEFRFGNGFGADARRKRHTADSGYGSEQPLDRRWSQEFGQENPDISTTEEARRLLLRAANCPRSPRGPNGMTAPIYQPRPVSSPAVPPPATPVPPSANFAKGSGSSSSSTSSGYSSLLEPQTLRPPSSVTSSASSSPLGGAPGSDVVDYNQGFTPVPIQKELPVKSSSQNGLANGNSPKQQPIPKLPKSSEDVSKSGNDSDQEREERRRAAQKVFGKQGSSALLPPKDIRNPACNNSRYNQPLPAPSPNNSKPLPSPQSSPSLLPLPASSNLSNVNKVIPQTQPNRQLRPHRQLQAPYQGQQQRLGNSGLNGSAPAINGSDSASDLNKLVADKLHLNNNHNMNVTHNEINNRLRTDMKAMQKEAVLSFVKSKQASPARSITSTQSEYSSTKISYHHTHMNGRISSSVPSATTTTTSIPLPSNSSTSSTSSLASSTSGLRYSGKLPVSQNQPKQPTTIYAARRDAEKSASADAHINQLRMQIETRLRISLPDDLATALVDGVILCHLANHVKPRSVPTIHVPSPAVPKLTPAKCRRNVENFLLACRRIGVREDLICSPSDILEPRKQGTVRLAISVSEVLRFHQPKDMK